VAKVHPHRRRGVTPPAHVPRGTGLGWQAPGAAQRGRCGCGGFSARGCEAASAGPRPPPHHTAVCQWPSSIPGSWNLGLLRLSLWRRTKRGTCYRR
jgi:hypothetical protein